MKTQVTRSGPLAGDAQPATYGVADPPAALRPRPTPEAESSEPEDLLRSLLDEVGGCAALLSPAGTVRYANRALASLTSGVTPGVGIDTYVPSETAEQLRQLIERVVRTGRPGSSQIIESGTHREAAARTYRVGPVVRGGRIVALTFLRDDITDPGRILLALRDSEKRYRTVVENARDAIYATTREGRFVDFNKATLDLLGYSAEELRQVDARDLYVNPGDRDAFRWEIEQRGSVEDHEVKMRRKDGTEIHCQITATLRCMNDGTVLGYQGIARDITMRKRLEREVLEATAREQQRIGHDLHDGLGQRLTGIAFLSRGLAQRLGDFSPELAAQATRIERLVNEAIAQTRRLARGLEPVAPKEGGLVMVLEELAHSTEQMFGVRCTCHAPDPLLPWDTLIATNVYRIAQEAVTNAVKHGHPTRIVIELRCRQDKMILTIRDDGTGIPRAPAEAEGLGTRIMQYRARMIGGSLELVRGSGGGTLVRCTFPAANASGGRHE